MTLPLPALASRTVRCRGCHRICRHRTWDGYGPERARQRGLIRPRRAAVLSGAADLTLFETDEGDEMGYNHCDHDYAPTFGGRRPRIVTLCGSTRFKDAFEQAERDETLAGRIVITVGLFGHVEGLDMGSDAQPSDVKVMLDDLHKRKIDLADEILVVSDRSGYFGASTRSEIEYARASGKPVRFQVAAPSGEVG